MLPQLGPFVSLQVLQAIEKVTDRSILTNLPRRSCPRVGKSGDATGIWTRSCITFLLSVSGLARPHIWHICGLPGRYSYSLYKCQPHSYQDAVP